MKAHHYKLDAFKWIRDLELDDPDDLPEPEELVTEAMEELKLALDELADLQQLLESNGGGGRTCPALPERSAEIMSVPPTLDRAALARPFMVQLDADGRVSGVAFFAGTPGQVRHLLRALVAHGQLVRAADAADRRQA